MKHMRTATLTLAAASLAQSVAAAPVIIDSELSDTYHFIDTYEILIDRPPSVVWPYLVDLASWMYDFDMIHETGPRRSEGAVLRLYEGQGYFMEITKLVPGEVMIAVNLPSLIEDEKLVGIAMFTLTEMEGQTLVSNFMSRHFAWTLESPDILRQTRESEEFQGNTRDRWVRFLRRLRDLAEGATR